MSPVPTENAEPCHSTLHPAGILAAENLVLRQQLQDAGKIVSRHIVDDADDKVRYQDANAMDILPASVGWSSSKLFAERGEQLLRDGTLFRCLGPHRKG
jgi:hypothetical protein